MVRQYMNKASAIGCHPEVWKLALTLNHIHSLTAIEYIQCFIIPFARCEYSAEMRLFKLRSAEHR